MNKELTPLQEINKPICIEYTENSANDKLCYRRYQVDIIETALKETEKIKKCYKNELKNVSYYNNLALKYKKAVEIIKEHRLDIDLFLQFVTQNISYQHYVYCVEQSNNAFAKRFLLNDEEYELLKEIFKR